MARNARISSALPRDDIPVAADVEFDAFELRKQVSIYVPISLHKALEKEAAQRKKPMTHLVMAELEPFFKRLLSKHKGNR